MDLSDCLILNRYFLSLFGKSDFSELAADMGSEDLEGYNEENTSYYYELIVRKYMKYGLLNKEKLKEYDENIYRYIKYIGVKRGGISLKYFQYLSLLFTEIYLDNYFNNRDGFIDSVNTFLVDFNQNSDYGDIPPFTLDGLNKVAFMSATGSGKTLIMHANILQYKSYYKKAKEYNPRLSLNKIILLTPNVGLSHQHEKEMMLSNIKCRIFEKNTLLDDEEVLIVDINKLVEEGKDKTVSVDSFEQNNLVLVDEGHKGLSGNVWFELRNRLSEDGFSFEYSATFKQAIKDEKQKKDAKTLAHQYGKAIIFDYSYKYFYKDGYGKDYRIYNLKDSISSEQQEIYLTGCLLSFYQQIKIYNNFSTEIKPFNIAKPLLAFVGNSVNKKASKNELSDVQEVLSFLNDFISERKRFIKKLGNILSGNTGLLNKNGTDLFYKDFSYIQKLFNDDSLAVYEDILKIVFSTSYSANLHCINLKQVPGEIALKVGSENEFFGVINVGIGGDNDLIKNLETISIGIITDENHFINDSLFNRLNEKDSNINMLIGAKKFTEGWNSYRVSTMGLINFAKGEGAQAIQLFGRGVRLKGYQNSLKRSMSLDLEVSPPQFLRKLETLTIFGVKANYMSEFKGLLEKEELATNETVREYTLPVSNRFSEIEGQLKVIKVKNGVDFRRQGKRLVVTKPQNIFLDSLVRNKIIVDYNISIQSLTSEIEEKALMEKEEHLLNEKHFAFLEIEKIYEDLVEYKKLKKYNNLILDKKELTEILKIKGWYTLYISNSMLEVDSFSNLIRIREIATMLLKGYINRFYQYHKSTWEAPHLEYSALKKDDKNIIKEYNITLYDEEHFEEFENVITEVKEMLDDKKELSKYDNNYFNFSYLDLKNHIYAPLISINQGIKFEVTPVSLNTDEKLFLDRLKKYLEVNNESFTHKKMYLLRNKSKTGMGFFEAANFYPDFVMWIVENDKQFITFIDPKGIMMLDKNLKNPKIDFYKVIKDIQERLRMPGIDTEIILNSFIMSGTSAANASMQYGKKKIDFESKNVLFLEDQDCIEKMMAKIK